MLSHPTKVPYKTQAPFGQGYTPFSWGQPGSLYLEQGFAFESQYSSSGLVLSLSHIETRTNSGSSKLQELTAEANERDKQDTNGWRPRLCREVWVSFWRCWEALRGGGRSEVGSPFRFIV